MGRDGTGVRPISGSSIEVTFSYKGQRCRERLKLEPTPANLKRAGDFLGAVRTAIATGTFDYRVSFPESKQGAKFVERQGDALLIRDFLEKWIARQKKVLSASTTEGYESIIKTHLNPKFGHYAMSDLKKSHVREWAAGTEFSNKRMMNVLSVLRAAFSEAVTDEIVSANPLTDFTYKRKEAIRSEDDVDPFTADEQRAITEQFEAGQERNLFQFAFWTGLRTSELIGLRWQDVDWNRETIRVQCTVTRAGRKAGIEETTKTTKSTRDVKLLRPALDALLAQKPYTFLLNASVFHNPRTGKSWHNDKSIRNAWNRSIHYAKVRYRRPYQTRHTYASMMLSAGEPPMWVANQMGHTSLKMIEERYGRWIKDSAPDAGNKAVLMFGGLGQNAGRKAGNL